MTGILLRWLWSWGLILPLLPLSGQNTVRVCQSCAVQNLTEAVARSRPGDTLRVEEGIYRESGIKVPHTLSIIGENGAVIDAGGDGEILTVAGDSSLIRGLTLRNMGVSYLDDNAAIRLLRCRGCRVEDNRLEKTFFGIYLQKSEDCIVRGNQIIGEAEKEASAGNAIHIWEGERILVEDNYATGHRDGIYFEFVDDSEIRGNVSEFNIRYGLHFMFSNRDLYEDNVFRDNGVGVAVMFSREIRMLANSFEHNWGGASYGILLKEISDGEMAYNTFLNNTKGILAEGANRLQIHHNDFRNNGWAIDIKGNCLDNVVENNNFIGNTFEVITNSRYNPNSFTHNYWSQYRGADLNRDGFGDVPYRPVSLHALIIGKVPAASMLLHSFFIDMLEYAERLLPSIVPEALIDEYPRMKPIVHDRDPRAQ